MIQEVVGKKYKISPFKLLFTQVSEDTPSKLK